MEWYEIIDDLNKKIESFRQQTGREPKFIVISDGLLNALQKQHTENNYLEYNGIKVYTTVRHKILGVF